MVHVSDMGEFVSHHGDQPCIFSEASVRTLELSSINHCRQCSPPYSYSQERMGPTTSSTTSPELKFLPANTPLYSTSMNDLTTNPSSFIIELNCAAMACIKERASACRGPSIAVIKLIRSFCHWSMQMSPIVRLPA